MGQLQFEALRKQADPDRLRARYEAVRALDDTKAMMDASLAPTVYMSASKVKP